MLLSRRAYDADEQWQRLRRVADSVRTVAEQRKVVLDLPASASIWRIRDELMAQGAADALRQTAFDQFGELGDKERLRVFPLLDVPATLPTPFANLAASQDVAGALGIASEERRRVERWFLVDRSDDGDTVHFLREVDRMEPVRDPTTGLIRTEVRTDREYLDLRFDRVRRVIFTSGGSRTSAVRLAGAAVSYAMGSGVVLTQAAPPTINAAVIEALIDSLDGRPSRTNVVPNDNELLPWKDIGARQVDIRQHPVLASMIAQGEQTAVTGVFSRAALGGSNNCPEALGVQADVGWTFMPDSYSEPQMLLRLYDRLLELSAYAGLLRPLRRAVQETLAAAGSGRITPALVDAAVADVTTSLRVLGASGRPSGGTSQGLFDITLLNLILAIAHCPQLSVASRDNALDSNALEKILRAGMGGVSSAEQKRIRSTLEKVVEGGADYMTVLKRGTALLRKAKC